MLPQEGSVRLSNGKHYRPGLCDTRQFAASLIDKLLVMLNDIGISGVEQEGGDGIIVTFSDGTIGGYVVEELLALRPIRDEVRKPKANSLPKSPAKQPR
jgi:hypothetical protein